MDSRSAHTHEAIRVDEGHTKPIVNNGQLARLDADTRFDTECGWEAVDAGKILAQTRWSGSAKRSLDRLREAGQLLRLLHHRSE